jgi:hypothetical protein
LIIDPFGKFIIPSPKRYGSKPIYYQAKEISAKVMNITQTVITRCLGTSIPYFFQLESPLTVQNICGIPVSVKA